MRNVWKRLHSLLLPDEASHSYVISRRAEGLLRFNLVLLFAIPFFLLGYAIWIPDRLPVAGPPMVLGIFTATVSLFILRKGAIFGAGQFLAGSIGAILITAQFLKVNDADSLTSFSSFLFLFPIPVLITGLFGRLSWVVPIALVMVLADLLFFFLVYPNPGISPLTARVGFASSAIGLVLITALLYLLRTIVDGAILRVEETNQSLSRFVPREFLRLMGRESVHEITLGESREADLTILFSDIRDFTGLAEADSPDSTFRFINDYLRTMGPVIRRHNGFIDKYIGDGILALFEKPEQAVRAGREMLENLRQFNTGREQGISIGIGVHTGRIMLGTIGEQLRMENTVIGDTVNCAARIESLTKTLKVDFLISRETLSGLTDPSEVAVRLVDVTVVKGKRRPLFVYEVLWENGAASEARQKDRALFEKGVLTVRSGDYITGKQLFEEYLEQVPSDRTAKAHLNRCLRVFNHLHGGSIFQKYGDISTVASIVEIFYQKIMKDNLLKRFFTETNMQRLKGHQTRFVAMLMGAPIRFDTRALEYAHAHLPITKEHFYLVAGHLAEALREGGMEESDVALILSRVKDFEKVIITRGME